MEKSQAEINKESYKRINDASFALRLSFDILAKSASKACNSFRHFQAVREAHKKKAGISLRLKLLNKVSE